MPQLDLPFIKNKSLLEFDSTEPHAFATYRVEKSK